MSEPTNIVGPDSVRSGKNTTGGALLKGYIATLKATPDVRDEIELAGGVAEALYGVLMFGVADDGWVDVQVRDKAIVIASAAIAVGARVTSAASGKAVTAAAGNAVLGLAITAAAADGDEFEVELSGPGGARMPG